MESLTTHPDPSRERARELRLMAQRRREWIILAGILAAVLLFGLNFRVVRVEGRSMEPTYHNLDTLLLWKTASLARAYRVGDVIVFQSPDGDELIKRIAFIQNPEGTARMPARLWTPTRPMSVSVLCLGGDATNFPDYLHDIKAARQGVPVRRTVYVLGDNTWNSDDSRDFGPISPDQILGKIVCRVSSTAGERVVAARPLRVVGPQTGAQVGPWGAGAGERFGRLEAAKMRKWYATEMIRRATEKMKGWNAGKAKT